MSVDQDDLRARLARASGLTSCAAVVCDALVEHGHPLPSVYLRRGGRLRCYGSRGYWHVLDGFPPGVGVIAETMATGRSQLISTHGDDRFLAAVSHLVSEACAAIVIDGRVEGVVNIESRHPLDHDALISCETAARAFGERAEQLGGIAPRRGWLLFADQTATLAQCRDRAEISRIVIDLAIRISGADSGMFASGHDGANFAIRQATGSLADELECLNEESLREIARWVDGPLSCYTVSEPEGDSFTGNDTLRDAGVRTFITVALATGTEDHGFLLVADRRDLVPGHEVLEQLEVLAALAAGAISTTRHLDKLVEMSSLDPLTGLGHSRAFSDRLRDLPQPDERTYAILSIDVDHFKTVNDTLGHEAGDQVLRSVAGAMSAALRADDQLFRTGGDEFAAVVAVHDDTEALDIADRISQAARDIGTSVSIGVAVGPHEMGEHRALFGLADSALLRAKRLGRDRVELAPTER